MGLRHKLLTGFLDGARSALSVAVHAINGPSHSGAGDIVTHNAAEFDSAGAAAGVQTNLDTHTLSTGTAVHGLGNSSVADVGAVPGTVCAGDDGRLSDARTPTAHAATHNGGGADVLAAFTGALMGADGKPGVVPKPFVAQYNDKQFLRGDAVWSWFQYGLQSQAVTRDLPNAQYDDWDDGNSSSGVLALFHIVRSVNVGGTVITGMLPSYAEIGRAHV